MFITDVLKKTLIAANVTSVIFAAAEKANKLCAESSEQRFWIYFINALIRLLMEKAMSGAVAAGFLCIQLTSFLPIFGALVVTEASVGIMFAFLFYIK